MKEYIDPDNWERLMRRWNKILSTEQKLELRYRRIVAPNDENHTQVIDVIQDINGEVFIETVECSTGEVETILETNNLSLEGLKKEYEAMLERLFLKQPAHHNAQLVVTMTPTSETTGEIWGSLERSTGKSSVELNYRHYYMLKALREKMSAILGERWIRVQVLYQFGMFSALEFRFEYENYAKRP